MPPTDFYVTNAVVSAAQELYLKRLRAELEVSAKMTGIEVARTVGQMFRR